ncbi:EARS [Mytilus edulis]|uniref:EARS n=1 Tax=Mytilus edulis TaxID=6550 RepID=A0A8S3S6Y1_MYTED|nr:EARS [Mytilus edulis]
MRPDYPELKCVGSDQWVSVHPDEGPFSGGDCGPYVQSERLHLYQNILRLCWRMRKIADGEMNELTEQIRKIVMSKYSGNISLDDLSTEYLEQIMCWCQNRISRLDELAGSDFEFLWLKPDKIDISNIDISNPSEVLQSCIECVKNMDTFDESSVGSEMKKNAKSMKVKFAPYMKFLRMCLSGLKEGPSVGEIMTVLGKSKTLERLKHASCICEEKESSRTRTES